MNIKSITLYHYKYEDKNESNSTYLVLFPHKYDMLSLLILGESNLQIWKEFAHKILRIACN